MVAGEREQPLAEEQRASRTPPFPHPAENTPEETTVTVQRTISIDKPVRTVVHRELVREVEVPEVREVEQVVEHEEVELRVRHVPVVTRREVPRFVDREVPGPVEVRLVERLVEEEEVIPVIREVPVPRPYAVDQFVDQQIPLLGMQRLRPTVTVVAQSPKPRVVLKRWNPKLVYVDIPVEVPLVDLLRRANIDLVPRTDNLPGTELPPNTARVSCSVEALPTTISAVTHAQRDAATNATPTTVFDEAHFNSWLLALNDHLSGRPEVMRNLPWARNEAGEVVFLPEGARLNGSLLPRETAAQLGVPFPEYMPIVTTSHGVQMPAEEAARTTRVLSGVGAVRQLSAAEAPGAVEEAYAKLQALVEPVKWTPASPAVAEIV